MISTMEIRYSNLQACCSTHAQHWRLPTFAISLAPQVPAPHLLHRKPRQTEGFCTVQYSLKRDHVELTQGPVEQHACKTSRKNSQPIYFEAVGLYTYVHILMQINMILSYCMLNTVTVCYGILFPEVEPRKYHPLNQDGRGIPRHRDVQSKGGVVLPRVSLSSEAIRNDNESWYVVMLSHPRLLKHD